MTRKLLEMAALLCLVAWQSHAAAWDKGAPTETGETIITSRLRGTWTMVSAEFMGMKVPIPQGQQMAFTFDGNKFIVVENMRREEGSYKVDESKSPKGIDLTAPKGKGQANETIKGIYKLDGDSLTIAFNPQGPGGARPTTFDAKVTAVIVFKRKR